MIDKIIEELEEVKSILETDVKLDCFPEGCRHIDCTVCVINKAIEIVKKHENDGWILCSERLPDAEEEVEISVERRLRDKIFKFTCRAMYEDGTITTNDSAFGWDDCFDFEYDEERDSYVIPSGWFEQNRYCEEFAVVDDFVIAWKPLPQPHKGE